MMTVACQTQDCISQTGVMGADPQLTYPTATGYMNQEHVMEGMVLQSANQIWLLAICLLEISNNIKYQYEGVIIYIIWSELPSVSKFKSFY